MSSCNIKLHIPKELINQVQNELSQKFEISGIINCDENNEVVGLSTKKGDKDSVHTENHVINFHTHPISAYKEGNTVWGWPSGEDIRETIKFALAGNKAHVVFTVEGVYVIQVNSCKIKKIKRLLNPEEIGVLIFAIEEYFKCTHNFRCIDELHKIKNKINPYSYIEYINNFDLSKLHLNSNTRAIKESIPSFGYPEIQRNQIKTVNIDEYIKRYGLSELRQIDQLGKEKDNRKIKSDSGFIRIFKQVLRKLNVEPCTNIWNNKPNSWFYVNFFPSEYYNKKMYLSNGLNYKNPNVSELNYTYVVNTEPHIKIFSNSSDGCTVSQISKINNFKIVTTKGSFTERRKSTFGNVNETVTPRERYIILFVYYLNQTDSIESLYLKINNFIRINKIINNKISKNKIQNELKMYF
jgi:hypothetical protein